MKFGSTEYLYLLWILPAMILLGVYSFRKKGQLLKVFADQQLWDRLIPEGHQRRQIFKFITLLIGFSLILFAFLRPRWGFHWEEIQRKGVDILVAVDVSQSMLAEDVKPNRLERAKREITDLVNMLEGDRIGLIAFAGASFLECPLTLDHGAFKMFLDYLDTDLIPVPGSDVGQAVTTAVNSFAPGRRASKAMILISDGEDHPREAKEQAEEAAKQGIRIFTVGIGSEEGAPIPVQGGSGGFKKDRQGQVILSKLGEASLQQIALATGGNYVRSVSGDMDLKRIYTEIREKLEAGELGTTRRQRWEERFQWFLFGGILLIALEALIPERKSLPGRRAAGKRFPFFRKGGFASLLCGFGLLLPSVAPASAESLYTKIRQGEQLYDEEKYDEALKEFLDAQVEKPEDILLKYNIGDTHYRMGGYEEAEKAFLGTAGSGDPVIEQKALYNLGNCCFRQGKLEEAVGYFQRALELDSEDEDARFNLEFVREEIKRRMEEAKKRQQEQPQSCQNPQKDQQGAEQKGQQNAGGEKGQQQDRAPQEQAEPPPEQGDEQRAQAAGTPEEQKEESPSGGAASQQAARGMPQEMSQEEAERWLNTLDEDQKELAQKQIRKALGKSGFRGGKDW